MRGMVAPADTPDTRFTLGQSELPTAWFNVAPHLSTPLDPPLHPGTREPVGPDDLAPLFAQELIGQEMSADPWIDIPGEVLDVLRLWRPTPLYRAHRLEREAQIVARLRAGDRTIAQMVEALYAAVDRALWPAASLSVLAHLIKLVEEGVATAWPSPTLSAEFQLV